MKSVSLAIITKNERDKIERCLRSVHSIVDEIILVDTGSTDNTKQIAIECGAKVYDFPWTGSFADARNYSLQQATGDWILVLDADEYLAPGSGDAIKEFISGPPAIGRVSQLSNYLDNGETRYESVPISRLFPKGVYYTGSIHEQVVSDLPHRMTSITVHHDGYFETDKTGRNIPLLEKELQKDGNNPYLLMQLAREHKNKQDYVQADYFFSQAYLYATKQEGYYPKLVVEYLYNLMKIGKLDTGYTVIQTEQNQDQLSNFPDFHFALGMFYMDYVLSNTAAHIDKLPRIEASFHKCLELGDRKEFGGIIGAGSFLAAYNLGVFYEVIGDHKKAVEYYHFSAEHDYQKAKERLSLLING